jgi:hypothetical protein
MKTPTIRVSLAFGALPDNTLITFCRNVHALIYTAPAFPAVPVTAAAMETAIAGFSEAKAAQPSGGKAATAEKNNKREALLAIIKEVALYAQVASNNDLATLLASGYEAVSTNRAQLPLPKPALLRIVPGMTGQSLVTLSAEKNARGCEVQVAEVDEQGTPGPFRPAVYSSSSRNIAVNDLTPGRLYAYQGRCLGGTTTYSDWSDQVVQRAA